MGEEELWPLKSLKTGQGDQMSPAGRGGSGNEEPHQITKAGDCFETDLAGFLFVRLFVFC